MLRLVPAGVLEHVDVFALQHIMPMIYLTTNDIVFVVAGRTYLLDHERCEPADSELARFIPHVHAAEAASLRLEERRRLARVMVVETSHPLATAREDTLVDRLHEPAATRRGLHVDLVPLLLPEVSRVVASGDRLALSSLLALLDLLARFDGHESGEVEILASTVRRESANVCVSLGACSIEVFGGRLDEATRARVLATLEEGVADDGRGEYRVHALIDKRESLSGSSGHRARLCLGRLAVSPAGFVYEDEVLWTEYEQGIEYS